MPKHVDSHKEIACDFDWESVPASQEICVVRREFPRPFLPRAKSADFARQAHAFLREPWPYPTTILTSLPGTNTSFLMFFPAMSFCTSSVAMK